MPSVEHRLRGGDRGAARNGRLRGDVGGLGVHVAVEGVDGPAPVEVDDRLGAEDGHAVDGLLHADVRVAEGADLGAGRAEGVGVREAEERGALGEERRGGIDAALAVGGAEGAGEEERHVALGAPRHFGESAGEGGIERGALVLRVGGSESRRKQESA